MSWRLKSIAAAMVAMAFCFVGMARARAEGDQPMEAKQELATFAGGCFWCMQSEFDPLDGIVTTWVGYTGGSKEDAKYDAVSSGGTDHLEAIQVTYNPAKVSYEKLLDIFWTNIDPTQADGQFADHGSQYKTAIFYHTDKQKQIAEASKEKLAASGMFAKPIVTEILPAQPFYPAEEYHQKYYKKKPDHYNAYSEGSGRKPFIRKVWKSKKP